MRILISNDDGVYSPGLSTLAEVAREFGEVKVFAPDVDRAASGHALSPNRPITWKNTPIGIEACRGGPIADYTEGAHVPAHGWHRRGSNDVASGKTRWGAELGLPLLLAARRDLHALCFDDCWTARRGEGMA